jgi:hypothetical protein
MKEPKGHQEKSAVHNRAIKAGMSIKRCQNLANETATLIEYNSSSGCYIYFASILGCFYIDMDFDKIVNIWPEPEAELPIRRVSVISSGNRV